MSTKLYLLGAVAALIFAFPAAAAERLPSAGAPYYLHWGEDGLCQPLTNWAAVGVGITYDAAAPIVSVEGSASSYNLLDITVDGHGTVNGWDDTLEMTLVTAGDGVDGEYELDPMPLYDPADSGDGGGGWTTNNTPKKLLLERIEYSGPLTMPNAVTNNSPVPMYARGFFGDHDMQNGVFVGGSAPECVNAITGKASGRNNSIDGGGGDDYIRTGFGNDSLTGGQGSDTIQGGEGNDILRGDGGAPEFDPGSGGVDLLQG